MIEFGKFITFHDTGKVQLIIVYRTLFLQYTHVTKQIKEDVKISVPRTEIKTNVLVRKPVFNYTRIKNLVVREFFVKHFGPLARNTLSLGIEI